ncbi:MAG TPA: LD-carboxypeptidase [Actinokineospora sp.]|nr:LD-carboxypeptidase [Actinokineospora sp.]
MTRPRRLTHGSTVAVIAPAGPVDPDRLDHGIAVLESWGLHVTTGKHILDRHPTLPYLAGRDADRAADLLAAWTDPDVDAVISARGGYGCQRMVDLLDLDAMAQAGPKVFTGSSDVTALHATIGAELHQSTLFAPMIAGDLFDAQAQQHLRATLFEPESVRALIGPNTATAGHGIAEGVTVGGTLSLIAADIATPGGQPPPDGSILLLEDVAETPYRIDRLLTQLLRAGWFTGVTGIALGSWADCGDVRPVIADLLGVLGLPMVWELGFGHCPGQLTIPLGAAAVLDADNGTLTMVEPALV